VYGHQGSTTELNKLIIFICFKLLKKILVSLLDEMAKKNYFKMWGKFCIFLHLVLLKKNVWSCCHGFKWASCHTPPETRSNMKTVYMMFWIINRRKHYFLCSYIYTISKMLHFLAKKWYILEDKSSFNIADPSFCLYILLGVRVI